MFRKTLAIIIVAAAAGLAGLLGLGHVAAQQQGPSATRSLSPTTVAPGGQVVVTIAVADYGIAGSVTEMLPDGFEYVSSPLDDEDQVEVSDNGQTVTFTLLGDTEFTYTVTAPATVTATTPYDFMGTLRDFERDDYDVGGATMVTVEVAAQQGPGATRSFSPATVAPGGQVVVTITAADYGSFGRVTEMLPAGFGYVNSSLDADYVSEDGQTVKFTLQGPDIQFTYTVTAPYTVPATMPYSFTGTLRDDDRADHDVSEVAGVTVEAGTTTPPMEGPRAARSFSPTTVAPGGQVVVTITAADYGGFGRVTEMLPAGFDYVNSSLDADYVSEDGQTIKFTLQGADIQFTYTVTAPYTVPATMPYSFTGTLRDDDRADHDVSEVAGVTVEAGTTTPPMEGPRAARSFSPTTVAPGGQVVVTITAADYGGFGRVTEMLPAGFDYVNSSLDADYVSEDGQTIKFTLQGADIQFTYTVTAPATVTATTTYPFMGTLRDEDRDDHDVGEVAGVTVRVGPAPRPPTPRPAPPANNRPTFPSDMVTYTIEENSPPGTNVGEPITATDLDGDTLTYTLGGADMADFRIDSASGQITVGPDTSLDFETKSMYTLAVMASDGTVSATTSVMVNVTDVDEPPPPDPCRDTLSGDGTSNGVWASGCESTTRVGSYVRYYTFTLGQESEVTITLESDTDSYLYLRAGDAKSGDFLHQNDDVEIGNTDSRIQETLTAGTYTIEATTWGSGATGSFTLTVSGHGDGTTPMPPPGPMPTDDPCRQTLPGDDTVTGEWADDCESAVGARGYARYYTFTLAEESEVTITLESDTDPYLYLREGEAKSGDFLHENDDIVLVTNTNSQIEETLAAGTYTIEATTYGFGETGSFTLTVSGLGDVAMPMPPQEPMPTDDPCRQTLSGAGTSIGMWASACESTTRVGSYARYYTFTLTGASEVTITLESDTDPYLYLREGEVKAGAFLHENDDLAPGTDTNSRIQVTLVAGTYTIEATTYSSGETGSFTLAVSGW